MYNQMYKEGEGMLFVITGNGKGKTTSALGMSLRMLGAGGRVFFMQFIKGKEYSEIKALRQLEGVDVHITGRECFIRRDPDEEDYQRAQNAFALFQEALQDSYDLYVLDELNIALYYELISIDHVLKVLEEASKKKDIVVTGRYAPEELKSIAKMVSEVKEIKHHYKEGIQARKGIEF
ncbi:MAG: cob(I)yrinic acid a,c-diamide adenosyltransferase [Tissierellia bacterium]|nr:cob(I)yrinic acid a,c-diamide adenosyltransferase [Tissierellia bacterium]